MPTSKQNIAIDELDEAIIAEFQQDGRQSNREVARKLNISEGSVRTRLKRLQESGAVYFDLITDVTSQGIGYGAYLRMAVSPKYLKQTLAVAENIEEIVFLTVTAGRYNVTGSINATNRQKAVDAIDKNLRILPGITKLQILPTIHRTKHTYLETVAPAHIRKT